MIIEFKMDQKYKQFCKIVSQAHFMPKLKDNSTIDNTDESYKQT